MANGGGIGAPATPFARLGRFLQWPRAEQTAFLYALVALPAAEIWLRAFGFKSAQRLFAARTRPVADGQAISPRRAYDIVNFASRLTIGSDGKCLRRALVLARVLRGNGLSAVVRVGFRKSAPGLLDGHAWCELDDADARGQSPEGFGYVRFL